VLAIQERFQLGDFAYSTDVPAPDGPGLLEFLMRSRVGFCTHYSSAMTVLVRSLGIPARIAGGFRVGTLQEDGSYLVRGSDTHVWVEVNFDGYGWLPFEPEHGATHPYAREGTYLNP
jgi:transglutaminase-like putative cysteine protease